MSDYCQGSLQCRPEDLRQALAIHTRKITDSCRDKDCIGDLRRFWIMLPMQRYAAPNCYMLTSRWNRWPLTGTIIASM